MGVEVKSGGEGVIVADRGCNDGCCCNGRNSGWAQVTGFRGETKELWQMEGRVQRDIWYIEHWTFLLDLYIMYKTVYNVIRGDKEAY